MTGASGQEAVATDTTLDAFASRAERRVTGCSWNSFVAVFIAMLVMGAAAGITLAVIQAGDSSTISFYSKAECGSNSGSDTGGGGGDVPASPGPELPGARWLRRVADRYFCAAVGAPLGEWRGAWLSESCGCPGGRGAPRLGFGGHGPPTATRGGGPWSRRAPRLIGTEPAVTDQASPGGNRGGRYLPNDGPRVALGRTSATQHMHVLGAWGGAPHGLAVPGVTTGPGGPIYI